MHSRPELDQLVSGTQTHSGGQRYWGVVVEIAQQPAALRGRDEVT